MAAYKDRRDCVALLYANDVELDIEDNLGRTPLHFAAYNNSIQCLVFLVKKGMLGMCNAGCC